MIEALTVVANFIVAISPFVMALMIYMQRRLRQYVENQIEPHLRNDDTSVASYARQARDSAAKALSLWAQADARLGRLEAKLDAHILGEPPPRQITSGDR